MSLEHIKYKYEKCDMRDSDDDENSDDWSQDGMIMKEYWGKEKG